MKIKYLLSTILLVVFVQVNAQNYKSQVINSNLSQNTLIENTMNWLLGYARTSKIKGLKAESSSGESISGDEKYINWHTDEAFNLLISNRIKYKNIALIKYNVLVKIKENKVLIMVKNVYWKGAKEAEQYAFSPINDPTYGDRTIELPENVHKSMLSLFDEYIQKEVFDSLSQDLKMKPEQIENWE